MKYLIIGVIAAILLFAVPGINNIPRLDEQTKASWSQVENQYQRRADLVPNLVASVKGYAAHERGTLEAVTQARANATKMTVDASQLSDPQALAKYEGVQSQLSAALGKLLAISENYPNLKADQNFLALQSQLEGTENRITVARRDYIGSVQQYNTYIRTFPGMLWAKLFDAQPKANFTAMTEGADKAPQVSF